VQEAGEICIEKVDQGMEDEGPKED
jgi:hypothetical protein